MSAASEIKLLDVVASLRDLPEEGLRKGSVGTVVEMLAQGRYLVEFSDDDGRAYAFAPLAADELLPLRYAAESA